MVMLEFVEAPVFTELLPRYLSDDEYRALQWYLARNPDAGDVIRETGGFRKVRWADRTRGQGRRGGLYGKDEASDLTAKERRLLKTALDEEKRQRARRRVAWRE